MCIRWVVETNRRSLPSTALRPHGAPAGMTIHILAGVRVAKKNCHPDNKVTNSRDDKG